jgi:hypothetical protein
MPESPTLNFDNPAAVAEWLRGLRESLCDADVVTRDMLRPKRKRDLGPKLHREHYEGAWKQVEQSMKRAGAPLDEEQNGELPASRDPTPNGDGGPEGGTG